MRVNRVIPLLILFVTTVVSLGFALSAVFAGSSPRPGIVKTANAMSNAVHILHGGFWRTDGGFVSTIRIKNVLVVSPMDVTPVIYMADGTAYPLRPVHLPIPAVTTLYINDALAAAPPSVANHISQYGNAALMYSYSSPGHVTASVAVIDAFRSLSYTFLFSEILGEPMQQTLEGLWWKHDQGVSGWIALSNATDRDTQANLQFLGHAGEEAANRSINLPANSTQMFRLEDFANSPSALTKQAGGIRVQY